MARSAMTALVTAIALVARVSCVQVPDLQTFFSSSLGLAMTSADAYDLATREATYLTKCSVTVQSLQELKDAMYTTTMLNLDMVTVRKMLLPLAYQHASPAQLNSLFQALSSSVQVGLPRSAAQSLALDLAMRHTDPTLLGSLYLVLSSYTGVGLPRSQAQGVVGDLAAAGADSTTLRNSYLAAVRTMGKDAALGVAIADAVSAHNYGLQRRYAKDGYLYSARDFQSHFGYTWLNEWRVGVEEKRTAQDGKDYRASEFSEFFGRSWNTKWAAAATAVQHRIAVDGQSYSLDDFRTHYGDSWQVQWAAAYEILDLCAGLSQGDCNAQQRYCRWQWTGDWTTSCVAKPLGDQRQKGQEEVVV